MGRSSRRNPLADHSWVASPGQLLLATAQPCLLHQQLQAQPFAKLVSLLQIQLPVPFQQWRSSRRRKAKHFRHSGTGSQGKDVLIEEVSFGRLRKYRQHASNSQVMVIEDSQVRKRDKLGRFLGRILLPQGYPHSVAPNYLQYTRMRGLQYFFGGAIGVFSTRSLLAALGVTGRSRGSGGEAAAAINWVLKDGAGRLGKFLFGRWGQGLDCELKQFRLAGSGLMEVGAALELSTIALPSAFLPISCIANLAKNLAGAVMALPALTVSTLQQSHLAPKSSLQINAEVICREYHHQISCSAQATPVQPSNPVSSNLTQFWQVAVQEDQAMQRTGRAMRWQGLHDAIAFF